VNRTRLLKLAVIVFFAFYFFKLLTFTINARLISDETLYAHIAQTIYHDKALPRMLPELYGGLLVSEYPPLFSIMGAAIYSILGINGFYLANIILLALLLASMFLLVRDYFSEDIALLACLFLVSAPMTAQLSLYFLGEMLTAFLAFLFFVTLYLYLASPKLRYSILTGLLLGLLVLTKQSGILYQTFCLAGLIWFAIKQDKQRVKGLTLAIALSIAVSFRYFLSNIESVKGFIEITFPNLTPILGGKADEMDRLINSVWYVPKWILSFSIVREFGWVLIVSFIITVFYFIRRWREARGYLIFLLLFVFLFIFSFISSAVTSRHFLPLAGLVSLLGAISICSLVKKDTYRIGIAIIVLISNVYSTLSMPDYRASYTLSPVLAEPLRFLKEKTPPDSTILSCWTYATFFYTGRNATWPLSSRMAPNSPTELFYEKDLSKFYSLLNKYKIDYILIDKSKIGKEFNSFNYPESMIENLKGLIKNGQSRIVYDARYFTIVEIERER